MGAPVKVPKPRPPTVWLTRDSDGDGLSPHVKVWLVRPVRYRDDAGHYWLAGKGELHGTYTLRAAQFYYKTIPDDDIQIIRNG